MAAASSETAICDTSFVGHLWLRTQSPVRYDHWDAAAIERVESALLAISVVTIAEVRFGHLRMGWGARKIAQSERTLAGFLPLTIDDPHLHEWARLRNAARSRGIAISDNDLWIGRRRACGNRF